MKMGIIAVVCVLVGGGYAWWWSLPLKDAKNLSAVPSLSSPEQLDQHLPHLARGFRAIDVDLQKKQGQEPPLESPASISARLQRHCYAKIAGGVFLVLFGIAVPIVERVRKRGMSPGA